MISVRFTACLLIFWKYPACMCTNTYMGLMIISMHFLKFEEKKILHVFVCVCVCVCVCGMHVCHTYWLMYACTYAHHKYHMHTCMHRCSPTDMIFACVLIECECMHGYCFCMYIRKHYTYIIYIQKQYTYMHTGFRETFRGCYDMHTPCSYMHTYTSTCMANTQQKHSASTSKQGPWKGRTIKKQSLRACFLKEKKILVKHEMSKNASCNIHTYTYIHETPNCKVWKEVWYDSFVLGGGEVCGKRYVPNPSDCENRAHDEVHCRHQEGIPESKPHKKPFVVEDEQALRGTHGISSHAGATCSQHTHIHDGKRAKPQRKWKHKQGIFN